MVIVKEGRVRPGCALGRDAQLRYGELTEEGNKFYRKKIKVGVNCLGSLWE